MDPADLSLLVYACRTCMKKKQNMHLIKECTDIGLNIYKMFNATVSQLDLQPEMIDELPKVICSVCLNKLTISYNFQKLCIETNERWYNILLKGQKLQMKEIKAEMKMPKLLTVEADPLAVEDNEQISEKCSDIEVEAYSETDYNAEYLEDEDIDALVDEFTAAGDAIEQLESIKIESNFKENETRDAVDDKANVELLETQKETSYVCADCNETFATATQLRRHNSMHMKVLNTNSDWNLNSSNQMRRHTKNEHFKCKCCAKIFAIRSHFLAHVNIHKDLELYKCANCSAVFQDKSNLKQHFHMHANEKLHLCPTCGKAFRTASNLSVHVKLHTSVRRFQCTECPSKFSCRAYLLKHVSTVHAKTKPYVCDICNASFSRSDILAKHKYIHSGERPHKCDKCQMSFAFIDHLRGHMRIHTGEKPFNCKYCDRAYAASGDLTRHLRTHVGDKIYMCTQCPEAFKYKAELRVHSNIHYKEQDATSEIS